MNGILYSDNIELILDDTPWWTILVKLFSNSGDFASELISIGLKNMEYL